MRIARVEVARFSLPLRRRYRVGPVDTDRREGRFVRVTSETGAVGHGEIAPLPGLHAEDLAEVDRVLRQVAPDLVGREAPRFGALAQTIADRVAASAPEGEAGCPSVVFGLQCAVAAVFAREAGTTPAHVLSPTPRERVSINALFAGDAAAATEAVGAGSLAAYPVVKVKAGGRAAEEDREVLRILLAGLGEHVRVRIDANRALTLDEALARFADLPPQRIEYLEEPLADPTQLADLHAQTGLPVALDETLHDPATRDIGRAPYVVAWCLKPSLVGHWGRMTFLAQDAARAGSRVVVSSAIESGLGLWSQVQMAAALPGAPMAAGLGTEGWLRLDTVEPPYDASRGFARTDDWQGDFAPRVLAKLQFGAPR